MATTNKTKPQRGRQRVRIEAVTPAVDGGRYPLKRIVGDTVNVEVDLFADGHDELRGRLTFRPVGADEWWETPLESRVNDRWGGAFTVDSVGVWEFVLHGWVDHFSTWRHGFAKKVEASQDVSLELLEGAALLKSAARRAKGQESTRLSGWAKELQDIRQSREQRIQLALAPEVEELVGRYPDRRLQTSSSRFVVTVDRERARFSTWYELFPRSCSPVGGKHGTFQDVIRRLPYVAGLGFDVLYLPPIHPIGSTHRKGKNNSELCVDGDPGSPWAIGAASGGHKSIHPQLGSLNEFRRLVTAVREHGMELALDVAFQCSPDHPYVQEHPDWFRQRPDGSIQYAENPPKKYQDIYPFDFECRDWRGLWEELESIFLYWMEQGVRIFRVDNPHTKPFAFWEWVIGRLKERDPGVLFLAEAFTRPKLMQGLAKLGFTQSYTYFTWRNHKAEITEYLEELTKSPVAEFMNPNFWPNTPDILHEVLQTGGRPAFIMRYVLAGTLCSNIGVYGPVYELCENTPREPGIEENRDNEKYEIRTWNLEAEHSIADIMGRVNHARRDNRALQTNERLHFHDVENDQLLFYSKHTVDGGNIVMVAINLDPFHTQGGHVHLDLSVLGIGDDEPYQVRDLLTDATYPWKGAHNFVMLDPQETPAHIFVVERYDTPPEVWLP